MVLVLARLVTWHLAAESAVGAHLMPRAERLVRAGLIAVPVLPVLVLVGQLLRGRPPKRLVLALVGLAFLGGLGSGGYWVWTFELFGLKYERTLQPPDGTRDAALYTGGLMDCHVVIFVPERGGWWGREAASRTVDCSLPFDAEWLPDGGVDIQGAPPKPLFGP